MKAFGRDEEPSVCLLEENKLASFDHNEELSQSTNLNQSTERSLYLSSITNYSILQQEESFPKTFQLEAIRSLPILSELVYNDNYSSSDYPELNMLFDQLTLTKSYPRSFEIKLSNIQDKVVKFSLKAYIIPRPETPVKNIPAKVLTSYSCSEALRFSSESSLFISQSSMGIEDSISYKILNKDGKILGESFTSKNNKSHQLNKVYQSKILFLSMSNRKWCLDSQMEKAFSIVFSIPLWKIKKMKKELGSFYQIKKYILEKKKSS